MCCIDRLRWQPNPAPIVGFMNVSYRDIAWSGKNNLSAEPTAEGRRPGCTDQRLFWGNRIYIQTLIFDNHLQLEGKRLP